jgi:single-strand DNA-binding protein
MNKVFLIGRLTRDPELRYSASNTAVMRCAIAVDRQFVREGEERGADFINIVAFSNRAETMNKYLTKGSKIAIEGRIQTGSYDDKDGKKVYTTDVLVDNFEFCDNRNSGNEQSTTSYSNLEPVSEPQESTDSNSASDPFADFGAKIEVDDNELPF